MAGRPQPASRPRRGALQRLSFGQLLMLAFLLFALLLGALSLQAMSALQELTLQSRESSLRALELSAQAQSLAERSLSLERSARQSVVLDDKALRERFETEAADLERSVQALRSVGVSDAQAAQWLQHKRSLSSLLRGPPDSALERERQLVLQFRELAVLHAQMAQQVRQTLQARNDALAARLEQGRLRLTQQVAWAVALAVAMALGFGLWFTRPLRRLEHAIDDLGENRLEAAIAISGPADLARLGQRLDWLRLRLLELDADKSRFLRHISHELKTPLASVREGASLLQDGVGGELNPDQREIVAILQHNTQLLQGQIEDLLRFNAAAFEARQLQRRPTDLLALLHAQVQAQQLQWRSRHLEVQIHAPQGAITSEVDADKLGTALDNLLSNAIRFSPEGGRIDLRLGRRQGQVDIDIQDQGPGVAAADRERIFEPFYQGQTQPPGARGSGVGLSIVHEYIAAHGGRITLLPSSETTPSGAHFKIELPHAPPR